MPNISPADLPAPPDQGNKIRYEYDRSLNQVLNNFINQTTRMCNTALLPYYTDIFQLSVTSGTTVLTVTFTQPLPSVIAYSSAITTHWNTTSWITNVTTSSFKINFGTAPVVTSTVDFFVYLQAPISTNT